MKWLIYLLEANIYLCIFYGFYKLLLERETFYTFNRWFLLTSVIVAFSLSLVQIRLKSELTAETILYPGMVGEANTGSSLKNAAKTPVHNLKAGHLQRAYSFFCWQKMLVFLYVFVIVVTLGKTVTGVYEIFKLFHHSHKYKKNGITHILIDREQEVFSFFNWLFYHPGVYSSRAIIEHELVHIRQKHSVDVLLIELVQALCWFNPVIRFIRADIKLNHEYLADEKAVIRTSGRHEYVLLLIDHAYTATPAVLTNAMFSSEQLKNRIDRLGSRKSSAISGLKYLLVIPLIAILAGISSFTLKKDYVLFTIRVATVSPEIPVSRNERIISKATPSAHINTIEIQPIRVTDTMKKENKQHSPKNITEKGGQTSKKNLKVSANTSVKNIKRKTYQVDYPVFQNGQVSIPRSISEDKGVIQRIERNGQVNLVLSEHDTVGVVHRVHENGQVKVILSETKFLHHL